MTRAINLIINTGHQDIQAKTHKDRKGFITSMSDNNIPYPLKTKYCTYLQH